MSRYNIAHKLGSKPRTEDVLLPEGENVDFTSMLLPQAILQGLQSAGFVKPSPIQLKAIPLARCGFDLIVQAKSGTGKTCVFAVTALENVTVTSNRLQCIILAPTREIAQQIQHVMSSIGRYLKNVKVKTFIGGVPLQEDKINLVNCQIAVGAPGRLKHLIDEGHLSTDAVRLVVLDEADKLMEETFQKDINFIFQHLPESKQVIACSATYTQDLLNFLGNYMQSATHVTPGQDPSPILIGLKHFVCIQPASCNNLSKLKSKETCLMNVLKNVSFIQCLVFSNYHSRAESICNGLLRNGWSALWIAGKQDQTTRTAVMKNVKDLKVRILVTTDLTARGIDLHEVNLVVNMDLPTDHQTYLHRMGRAGRYGGHGLVITIITEDEVHKFRRLLGAIEGSFASAYVIPDSKPSDDILMQDILKFEKIIGVTEDTAEKCVKDDDVDEDKEEKVSGTDDCDNVVENEDCKNENFVKLEDDDLNEHNMYRQATMEYQHSKEGTWSIKTKDDDVGISNENDSINNENLSCADDESKVKGLENSLSGNNDVGKNDYDPEKFSDSDDSESLNDNQNDDQIDSDHEYNDAISKFGFKLLNHTNNYTSNLSSYFDLDKSLCNFIECKSKIDENVSKKLLEPSGTIDFEYISKFTEKLNSDLKKLLSITNDLDSEKLVTWLMSDASGDCLSKVFDNSKVRGNDNNKNIKEIHDPEYYSQSSSSSLSSDNDDDDFNIGANKKLSSFSTTNNIRSVNKEMQMDCKETDDICLESFSKVNLNETSGKRMKKKENNGKIKKLDCDNCEKTVLFVRKTNGERKRRQTHNLSSSSSLSSNESTSNVIPSRERSDSNKFSKKNKSNDISRKNIFEMSDRSDLMNIKKSQEFNELLNPEKNEPNRGEKFNQKCLKSYEVSCTKGYQLHDDYEDDDMDDDDEDYDRSNGNQNSNAFANYYQIDSQEPRYYSASAYNCNTNSMPKEVQDWYNLWYRQNANLRWYVGYNQYMNYMLNLKK